jgi:hypothetical protein
MKDRKEGFTLNVFSTQASELAALTLPNESLVQSINKSAPTYNLPLKEYCIKGSYNTALTGRYVNLDMIKYVLSRGCRFLDFEIFYINGIPYVASSTDPTYTMLDTVNKLLLDDVLASVVSNAFAPPSPNVNDPLFIHLRVKSKDDSIYKAIAKAIDYGLKSRLFKGKVKKDTLLSEIMGKIIIVMDKEMNPTYAALSQCSPDKQNCLDFSKYVNLESGSEDLFLQNYDEVINNWSAPVMMKNDYIHTDILNMRLILPTTRQLIAANPPICNLITSYGCQIVPYKYYLIDSNLSKYEKLFDSNKTAFVSLGSAITYCKKLRQNESS